MAQKCEAHGLKLDLFCLGHNVAVCARCAQNAHFKCPQFVSVEDAAKYAKPTINQNDTGQTSVADLDHLDNPFTNYVKAVIESGEQNAITKFLKSSTGRLDHDNSIDQKIDVLPTARLKTAHYEQEIEISQMTSRDFQFDDGTEEYYATTGGIDEDVNTNLNTSRPFSADFTYDSENVSARNVKPAKKSSKKPESHQSHKSTPVTKKEIAHIHNPGNKSEVGQILEDVKKISNGLSSRDDVGITLDDLLLKIDRALDEISENFSNTRKQKTAIESQVKEIRKRLNHHLDTMEHALLNSLELKFHQVEVNFSSTIEKLHKGKLEIYNMKNGTTEYQNLPEQTNTLLAIREKDKQVRRMKKSVNALTENVYVIDMDVKINQDLFKFIDEIKTFGDVTVNSHVRPKIYGSTENSRFKIKRAGSERIRHHFPQTKTPVTKPRAKIDSKTPASSNSTPKAIPKRELIATTKNLSNIQSLPEIELGQYFSEAYDPLPQISTNRSGISGVRILQKKKVRIGHKWTSNVANCKMLPNGRLIFIDTENKRLVIHNKDTYVYRNLRVTDPPRDFVILDSDRVAVTYGVYIEILNILTSRIERRIHLEFFECNGISFMGGKFYIYGIFEGYLLSRHGIQIMDMHGRVEDRLPITKVQTVHHSIEAWNNRIYYTGYSSIHCSTASGEELWVFKHDTFDRPKSITIDAFGNVFAIYDNANKIVVISVDGNYSKEFELRKRDLYYGQEPRPVSVYFDTVESALIICNANKDHSVMYFVKYD